MTMLHRSALPVLVLVLSAGVALSAQDTTFEETVTLEPGGRLSLDTTRGSVRLTSWDQPTVEIRARIEPPSGVDDDYARAAVEGTTIEVEASGRAVRIRSNFDDVPRRGLFRGMRSLPRVHYEIRAPRQVDLHLDIDRSDTTVRGFEGRLVFDLDRSDLDASDLTGEIVMDLDRGVLTASDLSGDIGLDLDRGQRAVLDRVRGTLHFDLDRTSMTMRDVQIDEDSRVEIDRGDLDVQLVDDQALTIDADMSRRADLSSDLPLTMHRTGRDFRGTINGGGPALRIDADRSQIRLQTNQ
jgi:hypothetical protein